MSLSTVAAPIRPRAEDKPLPASRPERFERSDFIACALVFFVTLGVYIATLAPGVTLEDSGELITGAAKFGVPHPPGYPLWAMSGFLISQLLPLGNLGWRINFESALFAAAANAVLTLLVCHSGRWLMQRWAAPEQQALARRFCFYGGMLTGFALGFSDVMWSQAVVAEVYSLNALFVCLVLLLFYFWMLEPAKTHRLVITVFVFALGLTNHHTLIQIIPAILLTAACVRGGGFGSVLTAVNLFSLSILVYLSWLSSDGDLQSISYRMGVIILIFTLVLGIFNMPRFDARKFALGAGIALAVLAYGYFFMGPSPEEQVHYKTDPTASIGWLQIRGEAGIGMALLLIVTLGFLFCSRLNRWLIVGVFAAGWVGLTPYAYEPFASSTHPPMNWGYPSERAGFYYAVTRQQYPMSLPNLIESTIGKAVGVTGGVEKDVALSRPDYLHRLWLTFYYYGDNLQDNFTVPLVFLTLAIFLYLRRSDALQLHWFVFLAVAFFFLGFMLHVIEPPESFDFERNLQYKVFHLQSHCIFVILLGYGAIAAMIHLAENFPSLTTRVGGAVALGVPGLYLSLLPLWSNFNDCNQAGHDFGDQYGYDIMADLDRDAVFFGGSDAGRFVPTYMAFVESQQADRWKTHPGFDRRDVAVITQNAVCDTYYCAYIRDQYDNRFRPAPDKYSAFEKWLGRDQAYPKSNVICLSPKELGECWSRYESLPEVQQRQQQGGEIIRPGSSDVFDINAIAAQVIFEKNKDKHTFYLEQSVALDWTYPYLVPHGLVFRLNHDPLPALPPGTVEKDRAYWDAYAARLLANPAFRIDDDATVTFGKLAYWHADLYRWRHLPAEQEHWLRLALQLSPQLDDAVQTYVHLLVSQNRFDEAEAEARRAVAADPRNNNFPGYLHWVQEGQQLRLQEKDLRVRAAQAPTDVALQLQLIRLLDNLGQFDEVKTRLRSVAAMTNWDRDSMADVVRYYVDKVNQPDMAAAFLEERAKADPTSGEMIYSLAAIHASLNHTEEALRYLAQSAKVGGTNALFSARIDPRFQAMMPDPRFQALIHSLDPAPGKKKVEGKK